MRARLALALVVLLAAAGGDDGAFELHRGPPGHLQGVVVHDHDPGDLVDRQLGGHERAPDVDVQHLAPVRRLHRDPAVGHAARVDHASTHGTGCVLASAQGLPEDVMTKASMGILCPLEAIFLFQDYFPTFLKHKKGRRDKR